jgi:hypothetical protein
LRFKCLNDQGQPFLIQCPGFYTPTLETRLFSPQMYLSTGAKGGSYLVKEDRSVLCLKSGQTITMPLDPVSKLFYTRCAKTSGSPCAIVGTDSRVELEPNSGSETLTKVAPCLSAYWFFNRAPYWQAGMARFTRCVAGRPENSITIMWVMSVQEGTQAVDSGDKDSRTTPSPRCDH